MLAKAVQALKVQTEPRGGRKERDFASASIIGADLTIFGYLQSTGAIKIDGTVEGEINGQSVIVGKDGCVRGSVVADSIAIGGTVDGPVRGISVTIKNTARVVGNITHNVLTIEPGAFVEGRRPWRPRPQEGSRNR